MGNIIRNLLVELRAKDVYLKINDQQELEISVKQGKIPSELVEEIKKNKQEIIDYIKNSEVHFTDEIQKVELSDSYPISSSQKSLWIVSQNINASIAYNMPSTIMLEGIENHFFFTKAIESIIDRHEILRTVFKQEENGEIRQIILDRNNLGFKVEYKNFKESKDKDSEINSFIQSDAVKPFDLENGPLIRVFLLQKTDDSFVFYYNTHHIITDGWSTEILQKEVISFYESYKTGNTHELAQLRIQYKDYANWEHAQFQSGKFELQKQYWLDNLSGELPVLDLPTTKKRPRIKTYSGQSLRTYISSEEILKLKKIVEAEGGTLFMGILSVLKILLNKYTNEKDVIVGSVIAGREELELQNQIGFYVKVLVLRNQLEVDDSFLSFFRRLKENTLKAYKNQNYPFDQLVIDLNQKKDLSRSPVFDFTVEFSSLKSENQKPQERTFNSIGNLGECVSKTDIEFHFHEIDDTIDFNVIYNSDVYEADMINRFISNFREALLKIVEDPNVKIGEIDYLSKAEKNQLLLEFNDTRVNYPGDKTIIDLFEEQVQKTPNNIAVEFNEKVLTYQKLNELSNQLGDYLRQNYSIKPDDLVGIELDRSEAMILAVLGILKSGAAYVPIDVNYPQERISFIKEDIKSKVIIDENELNKFYLESDNYSGTNLQKTVTPDNLAYVIYTSGTTGKPKGALLEHKNVVRLFFTDQPLFDFNETDVWTLFHSYSFDFSVWEMYGALLYGGKLIVIPKMIAQNTPVFLELIQDKSVSILNQTPSAFYNLIECDKLSEKRNLNLRYIIFGGEALNPFMLSNWYHKYPEVKLVNMYGITETTVHVTYKEIGEKEIGLEQSNIGKPIPTLSCYILDPSNQIVPIGVYGEMYISGSGLARGYLNRPYLTLEKFITNPFIKGEMMYKTGDLGRWLSDGNIEYKGRIDDQVKIRGHRIELEEIETNLLMIDAINQSVVTVNEKNGVIFLVAYYVSDLNLDKKEIQSGLKKILPDYMVPGYYIRLESIPLTSNGKVDRKALPEFKESDLIKEIYVAPGTEKEIVLAAVWSSILGYENISIKDSFYNLGGDSIKSILVISKLKQQGYALKVDQLLRNPILEDLAKLLTSSSVIIDQSEAEGEVVLTPIQHYFFENEFISNKNHYNQSIVLRSSLEIESDILDQSIASLIKHHDALRMVYKFEDDAWKQYNASTFEKHYKINFYDLRNEEDEPSAMSGISQKLQSGFDITSGILFQIGHFRLSDGDRLVIIIHHLVVDGVSWRILMEDLSDFYLSYQNNSPLTLPLKSDSFQHWASLLKEYSKSDEMKQERLYWNEMSNVLINDFPIEFKLLDYAWNLNLETGFTLDKTLTEKLKTKVHGIYNTEINDILLTGLSLAIQEVFNVDKAVVLMEGHGREEIIDNVTIGRTIGWFTSIYPFVLDISNSEGYELVHIKESLRKVPNKGIGYGILNYLDTEFENQLKPSLQFNYLGDFGESVSNNTEDNLFQFSSKNIGEPIDKVNTRSNILLDISGIMVLGELNMSIRYSDNCFSKETIDKLKESYQDHLASIILDLASKSKKELTPSDLTYKKIKYPKLLEINNNNTIEDIYELSPLQQGLYYSWLINPSNSMFFIQTSYNLKLKDLDIELVKESFNKLIARYPVLRTSFNNNLGDSLLQIVHKEVEGEFSYEKLLNSKQETEETIKRIKEKDLARGFDLHSPFLMRLNVVETDTNEYVFIWSHHHILMDGWCVSILVNDFYRILISLANNQQLSLPEPMKYSTYIQWLSKVNKAVTLSYWKKYLAGLEIVTDIPFKNDRIGSNGSNPEFKKEILLLDGVLFENISTFNKNLNITWNTFIQGVWGYLLARYNNTKDVVFGSVVSGRPGELEGIQDIVGLFSNTIPVRIQYNNDDTPRTFLKRLHLETLESTPHHYTNLAEVQSQSILGMDLIKNLMVFENFFVQDAIEEEIDAIYGEQRQGITIDKVDFVDQSNYNFDITIMPSKTALKLLFRYNSEVFDSRIIQNLTTHFINVATQFSDEKDTSIQNVNYVSQTEKDKVVIDFNDTALVFAKDVTIVDLFEEQVENNPDSVAVFFDGTSLTYKELDSISNSLSISLKKDYGVQKGDFVGVHLHRSEWSIISFLGILKAGAVYVPIDYELPDDRKSFIFSDTGLKVLLTETAFLFDLDFYNGTIFSLDVEFDYSVEREVYQKEYLAPNDLAYVIYTSGSTGNPKGVMIEHTGIANTILSQRDAMGMKNYQRSLQFASFSFDTSIWDIFNTLLSGCSLYILNEETRKDIKLFETYIIENQIEIATLPPAFLKLLNINCLKNLKILITAGEAAIHDKVSEYLEYGTFYNSFGPTESSISCTGYKVEKGSKLDTINIPIGKPIDNVQIYILDEFLNPCGIGVYGELYIAGAGLARGYINRLDLTSNNFVSNPFIETTRMYKSGDLARWLPDGNLEYKGRLDDQVKLHGYRIELGEIQNRLTEIEGIKHSVVIIKQENDDKYLVAYYVSDLTLDKSKIQLELSKVLPVFMLPAYYVQLPFIPITANGKVDKKSLPSVAEKDLIKTSYIAPSTREEIALAAVWAEVLKYDVIGKKDNFYNLGGDSIKSLMVIFKLKELDFIVKVEHILQNPILEDLAKCIENTVQPKTLLSDQKEKEEPAKNWQIGDIIELSPKQMRFYKMSYSAVSLRLRIPYVDLVSFEKDFRDFISYMPNMTIGYEKIDNTIFQRYLSANDTIIKILVNDLGLKEDKLIFNQAQEFLFEQPFDLQHGELIRIFIVPLENQNEATIGISFHHSLSDAHTTDLILKEATTYFNGDKKRTIYQHPFDFVDHQRKYLNSNEGLTKRDNWKKVLENYMLSKVETHDIDTRFDCLKQKTIISGVNFEKIQELSKNSNLPISILFNAFYLLILNRVGVKNKKLYQTFVSGREQEIHGLNTERILGVIDNVLISNYFEENFDLSLNYIKNLYLKYLNNRSEQTLPHEVLRTDFMNSSGIDVDSNTIGFLNFLRSNDSILAQNLNDKIIIKENKTTMKFDISLACQLFSNGISVQLVCNKDFYNEKKELLSLETYLAEFMKKIDNLNVDEFDLQSNFIL